MAKYKTLLLDIGGVILTNGWDRNSRALAAKTFQLDQADLDKRHALTFDTFEIGKISLDTYINRAVFYTPRSFTLQQFKEFMFTQSQPHKEMLELIRETKKRHSLRIIALTNEGKELMLHRIKQFHLNDFIDFFVCSAFVGMRKPDLDMYHLALNLAHAKPEEVIYIDDRELLAEIGKGLGLMSIQHKSYDETAKQLQNLLK